LINLQFLDNPVVIHGRLLAQIVDFPFDPFPSPFSQLIELRRLFLVLAHFL
jgi:hypothetical protein